MSGLGNEPDKLEEIMHLQDNLNSKFGMSVADSVDLTEDERLKRIISYMNVLQIEISEVLLACKVRWWKIDKDWKGMDHVRQELIDALHFLLCGFLASGMDAKMVYSKYCEKNKKNHTREDWEINQGGG